MFERPLVRTLTGFNSLSKTLDSWYSIKLTVALTTTNLRTGQNLIIFWVVRKAPSGGICVDSLKIRCKMDHAKWKGLLFRALRSHSCPFLPFGVGAKLFSVCSSLWQKTCIYFTSFFFFEGKHENHDRGWNAVSCRTYIIFSRFSIFVQKSRHHIFTTVYPQYYTSSFTAGNPQWCSIKILAGSVPQLVTFWVFQLATSHPYEARVYLFLLVCWIEKNGGTKSAVGSVYIIYIHLKPIQVCWMINYTYTIP